MKRISRVLAALVFCCCAAIADVFSDSDAANGLYEQVGLLPVIAQARLTHAPEDRASACGSGREFGALEFGVAVRLVVFAHRNHRHFVTSA